MNVSQNHKGSLPGLSAQRGVSSNSNSSKGKHNTNNFQARFQGGEGQFLSSYNGDDQNRKLKVKRAQTLKQDTPNDKVIEEFSEDNDSGFASETPANYKAKL